MMKILAYIALAILGIATGCRSGSEVAKAPTYPPPPADITMTLKRVRGGDVNVELAIKGTGADTSRQVNFVRNITGVRTLLYHPEHGLLDTLVYSLAAAFSEKDGAKTMTLDAMSHWANTLGIRFDSLYTQTLIVEKGGVIYASERGFSLPAENEKQNAAPAIELRGWVEEVTDSSALFVVLAERKRQIDVEYFPTSERLRVILSDEDGALVWNSQNAQAFLQMTSPVEPNSIDAVKRYELPWNGVDDQGKPLPPGRYKVVLMLPARPSPYSVVIPFNWKVPDDK